MKVLVIAPQPFFVERGTPIAVRLLAATIAQLGHTVDLLVFHEGDDVSIPGVTIQRITAIPGIRNIPVGFSLKKLMCDGMLALRLFSLSFRGGYDVMHAVEESVFPALLLRPLHRAAVIYDMDSSLSEQMMSRSHKSKWLARFFTYMERWAMRRSDAVAPVCGSLAEMAEKSRSSDSIFLLPDIPLLDSSDESDVETLAQIAGEGRTVSLYVGNLEHYQGIDLLLEAMAKIPDAAGIALLVIGGNEQDIEKYGRFCATSDLADTVHFLGPRPLKDLGAYLRQADILVSPRISGTNTPMKLYSYMGAGRAILATRLTTHTQVLDDTMAMLSEPDVRTFADKWVRLANDRELRSSLGTAASREVQDNYSRPAFVKRVESLYSYVQAGTALDQSK